jgi:hypothetical protein
VTTDFTRTWTIPDRRPDHAGPWDGEPDKAQWIDQDTGLDCLIVRNRLGTLCGYVGVPAGHPWHGQDYDAVDADVHGGLTYSARCQEYGAEHGICHVPEPGRPDDVWWLGFDCGHLGDLAPGMESVRRAAGLPPLSRHETYRDVAYVRAQCQQLAAQAAAVAS